MAEKKNKEPMVKMPKVKKAKEEDKELQGIIKEFILSGLEVALPRFGELPLAKQFDVLNQLLPYATPKMQQTIMDGSVEIDPLHTQLGMLSNGIKAE